MISLQHLTCACCGSETVGRQWWNRDKGYGLCPKCYGYTYSKEGIDSVLKNYGHPDFHYFTSVADLERAVYVDATIQKGQMPLTEEDDVGIPAIPKGIPDITLTSSMVGSVAASYADKWLTFADRSFIIKRLEDDLADIILSWNEHGLVEISTVRKDTGYGEITVTVYSEELYRISIVTATLGDTLKDLKGLIKKVPILSCEFYKDLQQYGRLISVSRVEEL